MSGLSPYEDILEGRRNVPFGDFSWCTREWEPDPKNEHLKKRSPQQIKKDVLGSPRVRAVIQELACEHETTEESLHRQAEEIVDEMGHNFNMHTVRWFGYVLSKLGKRFYQGIYVNRDGIEKLRCVMKDHPVILLPSHRSYVDFLLISYVFFNYNLPMPIIAAGMDFMAMKFVAERLRDAGAFFMRRSFGGDKLYRAVFAEYVQTHMLRSEAPIEFFVEGTRSRTAKSLCPKIGLLSMATEPYFRGLVPDVLVVPISLSYDRTLEETLYAYELLGSSKPPESTSGLVRALGAMDEDYGTLHMHVCDPVSVRRFANGHVDRPGEFGRSRPPHLSQPSTREVTLAREIAHTVLKEQQAHQAVSIFTLVAVAITHRLGKGNGGRPGGGPVATVSQLSSEVSALKARVEGLGSYVATRGGSIQDEITGSIGTHRKLLGLNSHTGEVEVLRMYRHEVGQNVRNRGGHCFGAVTLEAAVTAITMQHYVNKCLHLFAPPAMIVLALAGRDQADKEDLFSSFRFLRVLLSGDFPLVPGREGEEFEGALHSAETLGVARRSNALPCLVEAVAPLIAAGEEEGDGLAALLGEMMQPFLVGYAALAQVCCNTHQEVAEKELLQEVQALLEHQLAEGNTCHYSALSLDILRNGVHGLALLGALRRSVTGGTTWILPHERECRETEEKIAAFLAPSGAPNLAAHGLAPPAVSMQRSRAKL